MQYIKNSINNFSPFFVDLLTFNKGQRIDFIKTIAVIFMVIDHINILFFDRKVLWMFFVGRLAFPIFAVIFAINLGTSNEKILKATKRFFVAGIICQAFYLLAFWGQEFAPWYGLNIIFTFCVAAFSLFLWQEDTLQTKVLAVLVVIGFGWLLQPGSFGYAGLAFIFAARYCTLRANSRFSFFGFLVWFTALLAMNNFNFVFSLIIFCSLWGVMNTAVLADRVRQLQGRFMPSKVFYWIYGGHLFLMWAVLQLIYIK